MRKLIARLTLLLAFLLVLLQGAFSQTRTVTGTVTDQSGVGVPGVTVSIKGTNNAVVTTETGSFSISAPSNATLVFSSVGYGTIEIPVQGRDVVNTTLSTQGSNLDEVVVIGYGTARRRDLTGSVSTVQAKDFNKGVITAPDQLIQGKAAGVLMINNSGQPGGATTVRVRGTSSIRSGNNPLYVVDGVPLSGGSARPGAIGNGIGSTPGTNPLNFMNPNDIASIDILKDASATAIYGSRGANGVILITTKRGQTGDPSVDLNVSFGVSNILKRLEVLSASEYVKALGDYGLPNTVWTPTTSTANFGGNVDALDAILRTAYTQNYNLGFSGGGANSRFRLSVGYLNQEGIVRKTDFKKYATNLSGNFKLLENRKLNLDYNVMVSATRENLAPISNDAGFTGSLIGQALQWNPTHPLRLPNDSIWVNNRTGATTINPLAMSEAYNHISDENVILASIAPSYKLTTDLEYKFLYSITRRAGKGRGEIKRWLNLEGIENRGIAYVGNNSEVSQQFANTLSYNKQINPTFNLNAVIGHEYLNFNSDFAGLTGQDFSDVGGLHYWDIMGYSTQNTRNVFAGSAIQSELQSYFGRAIVNIRDRYLLTATLRTDGSSRFGKNNRYGWFPSVGAAWNITNEDFFTPGNVLSNLKLRLGWGKTGNQEFAAGAPLDRWTFGGNNSGISQAQYGNPDLKWETSTTFNAGIDYSLLSDRLWGSVDYFHKKTTDPLFEQDIAQPGPAGPKVWVNLDGSIVNSGVEIVLNTAILRAKELNWNVGVNLSLLENEVQGIPGFYETGALHGQGISGATSQRLISGQPLNVFYLPIHEGIDKTTGQSIYQGGDPASNKFYVGDPNPRTLLGISTDVQYKKFSAYISMNGIFGHYLYNNTANTVLPIGNLGTRNVAKSLINPDLKEAISNPITPSTRYLEKGDYFKLANATLSYNFGSIGTMVKNVNVSLTGQNLLVFTKFTGFDPEVNTDKSVGGIPSIGLEYTPYPTSRTILLGFNFSF
jgi:TonB-dependent starch-binding outer membrane protein SusC